MNLPPAMLAGWRPASWPAIWLPKGVSGVSVPATTTTDAIAFRIPAPRRVYGLHFFPQSGLAADAAAIELRIQDEEADDLIFDTVGTQTASEIGSFSVPALALSGVELGRLFAIDRVVEAGRVWTFTIRNRSAGAIVPIVALLHEAVR